MLEMIDKGSVWLTVGVMQHELFVSGSLELRNYVVAERAFGAGFQTLLKAF